MVRAGDHGDFTRFVLDLTNPVTYRYFTLENPHRLVIDIQNATSSSVAKKKRLERNPLIKGIRYGIQNGQDARIVLDLTQPVKAKEVFLIEPRDGSPYRLVFDLFGQASAPLQKRETVAVPLPEKHPEVVVSKPALSPAPSATPAPREKPSDPFATEKPLSLFSVLPEEKPTIVERPVHKPENQKVAAQEGNPSIPVPVSKPAVPEKAEKMLVVIDPGHGGQDPGATGQSGMHEKYLTLDYAMALGKALEATGKYRVLLTRYDDRFVRLDGRVSIARKADANLFISLHADSHNKPDMRGLSVYTLSDTASDREAAVLASKHNKSDILTGVNLGSQSDEIAHILIDFAHRDTSNQSSSFAETLVTQLKKEVRLLNKAHRFAGFRVLTAPDIPSVLIELGYLSNPNEERLLRTTAYKNKLVNAIIRAIDTYFQEQTFETKS